MRKAAVIRILLLHLFMVGTKAPGVAQQHHHAGGEGASSDALLKLGAVHFPISCSAAVQTPFERGIAMLQVRRGTQAISLNERVAREVSFDAITMRRASAVFSARAKAKSTTTGVNRCRGIEDD
jgi:hypothetical protein